MVHLKRRSIAWLVVAAALGLAAFSVGRSAATLPPNPILFRDGVPAGVAHSPAGAVAAANEYLATEQATVERNPAAFSVLVANDYVRSLRTAALVGAARDRARDPAGMKLWAGGGQSFTVIGADRMDGYRGSEAQVTAWAGQVLWGPSQAPTQVWSLSRTTLVWRFGRWEIASMSTLSTTAPSPAVLPQAAPTDDSSAILDSQLAGFTPVSYGAPG